MLPCHIHWRLMTEKEAEKPVNNTEKPLAYKGAEKNHATMKGSGAQLA